MNVMKGRGGWILAQTFDTPVGDQLHLLEHGLHDLARRGLVLVEARQLVLKLLGLDLRGRHGIGRLGILGLKERLTALSEFEGYETIDWIGELEAGWGASISGQHTESRTSSLAICLSHTESCFLASVSTWLRVEWEEFGKAGDGRALGQAQPTNQHAHNRPRPS